MYVCIYIHLGLYTYAHIYRNTNACALKYIRAYARAHTPTQTTYEHTRV